MSREVSEKRTAKVTVTTYQIPYGDVKVDLVVEDRGEGQPFLLLHGGAGPASFSRFATLMTERYPVRVITPTHPGFSRTIRPDGLNSVKGLAQLYTSLIERLGVSDVTVIGNSIGGWIAAEIALLNSPRISGVVLIDAAGIEVSNHPIADVTKLTPDQLMRLSYHNPQQFQVNPSTITDEQRAIMASNRTALSVYAGQKMFDPSLVGRLGKISVPALLIWGDSDGIVDPDYGRAFAAAIPHSKFLLLEGAGHLPQIETPDKLLDAIWNSSKH